MHQKWGNNVTKACPSIQWSLISLFLLDVYVPGDFCRWPLTKFANFEGVNKFSPHQIYNK